MQEDIDQGSATLDLSELGDEDVNLSDGEYEDFGPSARRVLREIIRDELGISKKAMKTLNSIPNAMSKRIVTEAAAVAVNDKRSTLTWEDMEGVRLLLSGELARHAIAEGRKCLNRSR